MLLAFVYLTDLMDVEPELYKIDSEYAESTNVLGLVMFSVIFGVTLGKMGPKGKPLLDFFNTLSEAMMIITNWVIW